jgi:uncharacterized coiled-coil protein SlyX
MTPPVSLVTPLVTGPSVASAPVAVNPMPLGTPSTPAVPAEHSSGQVSMPAPAVPAAPAVAPAIPEDVQRRLLELAVERETMSVRLEDALRSRADLEARLADLESRHAEVGVSRQQADQELSALTAERDRLAAQVGQLQDEVLRLPEEFQALQNSRAFKIMRAGPFLAMRQPLSTLLIIAGMGVATNLWSLSALASSIYVGVGGVVLLVSAIQFWARND